MGEHRVPLNAYVPVTISPLIQMEPSAGEDAVGPRKKQVAWSVVLGPGPCHRWFVVKFACRSWHSFGVTQKQAKCAKCLLREYKH